MGGVSVCGTCTYIVCACEGLKVYVNPANPVYK